MADLIYLDVQVNVLFIELQKHGKALFSILLTQTTGNCTQGAYCEEKADYAFIFRKDYLQERVFTWTPGRAENVVFLSEMFWHISILDWKSRQFIIPFLSTRCLLPWQAFQ